MDLNEQVIIGTVGQEPTTRGAGQNAATVFTVATGYKQGGTETTIWNNIVTFGKSAEICSQYLSKGSRIFIRGRVSEYKYRREGENMDRVKHEIIAEKIVLLSSKGKTEDYPKMSTKSFVDDDIPF